jgi:hypothetical protein
MLEFVIASLVSEDFASVCRAESFFSFFNALQRLNVLESFNRRNGKQDVNSVFTKTIAH